MTAGNCPVHALRRNIHLILFNTVPQAASDGYDGFLTCGRHAGRRVMDLLCHRPHLLLLAPLLRRLCPPLCQA